MSPIRFWIATPTFESLRWLPCAVASVADQAGEGIELHHHVQDGGSKDGTREWLASYAEQCARAPRAGYTFSYESVPDEGMYDAINKGWSKAPADVDFLAHLNSDEQYLPGALQNVAQAARAQPGVELLLGDALVVDAEGHYICHQSSIIPWRWMTRYFCTVLTCTAFYRRQFLLETGVRFDPTWRIAGDLDFYYHLFKHRVHVGLCNQFTSVFVDSGKNLAIGAGARDEIARFRREYGNSLTPLARGFHKIHTLRRIWKDLRRGLSRDYRIYPPGGASQRTVFKITRPTSLWGRRIVYPHSQMIKKVHYCWFGGKLPAHVAANVEKWKQLNPDFEFCEWNEGNTDVSAYAFGRRALDQKRWAFVTDIVRLQKLYEQGGVYLDTDVELISPLSTLEQEGNSLVLGYMFNCTLGTAVLYSPQGHPLLVKLLEEYHHIRADAWPVNNTIFTDYFLNHVPGFLLNGRRWKSEAPKISLFPKEYFEQPAFVRERGFSIHHYSGSWMPEKQGAAYIVTDEVSSHKIKWLKRKIRTFVTSLYSAYRRYYWHALLGHRDSIISSWRDGA